MNRKISPYPKIWLKIHDRLIKSIENDTSIPPPPAPLILNGWVYSSNAQKYDRWMGTLSWAKAYNRENLIGEIPDEEMYCINEISDYEIGPMGGPIYLKWNYNARPKTSATDAANALVRLKEKWVDIIGPEIGQVTIPLRFTGTKGRRLVVAILKEIAPPWGTWTTLAKDERRYAFTKFRAAINLAIKPIEVDHIDFVQQSPKSSDGKMLK